MFIDRADAGRQLAARLAALDLRRPLVLGIPRGGVVVAAVIAGELDAELDVVLSRKLRAPMQRELAVGAVTEDGRIELNDESRLVPGLTQAYLAGEREHQLAQIEHRRAMYRAARPPARAAGRSVIVTDDGIATGATMLAALGTLRAQQPHELIAAIPVAPPDRLEEIARRCDRVVCLSSPASFHAVGQFYRRFDEVSDDQVVALLAAAKANASAST